MFVECPHGRTGFCIDLDPQLLGATARVADGYVKCGKALLFDGKQTSQMLVIVTAVFASGPVGCTPCSGFPGLRLSIGSRGIGNDGVERGRERGGGRELRPGHLFVWRRARRRGPEMHQNLRCTTESAMNRLSASG